tara:strand:- start:21 stop:470 length:450 start_codon:yes stop_codon:yes gene_type:complete
LTALANYGKRGRQLTWLYFAQRWYREITDASLSWDDIRETAYLGGATVSLLIPDPLSTAIGYTATKLSRSATGTFSRASVWWAAQSLARRTAITYVAFLPLTIAANQQSKATQGLEAWDEGLGLAMWEAQAVPSSERLKIPTITSSRVF